MYLGFLADVSTPLLITSVNSIRVVLVCWVKCICSCQSRVKRMQTASEEAEQAIANCWAFLDKHRSRTHYLQLRRGGYPLGSGGIESSNKFICHTRLKRSGAWWYEVNCNQMLALRCAKYNGTFDQVFVRHRERLRAA
jgi:hypothetical protein